MINLVVIVLLSLSFGRQFVRDYDIQKDIDELQKEANALMATNISITELQTAVQTKSFIEREARLKLGMKKPGETVVIVKEKSINEGEFIETSDATDPLGLVLGDVMEPVFVANHSRWWYYFFNKNEYKKLKG